MSSRTEFIRQAKSKAGKYCAFGERSPKQVHKKLLGYGLSQEEAISVISELEQEKFIDISRFAKAFANDKFRFNQWGKSRIRQELRFVHSLEVSEIELALNHIDDDAYQEQIRMLIIKKWDSISGSDSPQKRKKVASFLIGKGYEPDLVFEDLKAYVKDFLN